MKTQRIAIFLSVTILIAASAANAADPVNIPDPALKAAIEAALGIANPTPADMLKLSQLWLGGGGIKDLTGLEYARNLTLLQLGGNVDISDISPLAGLTKLQRLWLDQIKVSDLSPLSGLKSLEFLSITDAQVSDIGPLSGLTNLVRLLLPYNQRIADISALVGMTKLQHLRLEQNQISDIRPLAKLADLNELILTNNNITDISPLSGLTNLTLLALIGNKIGDIGPLAGLTKLTYLDLDGTGLADTRPLAKLKSLTYLNLSNNRIGDLTPLSNLTALSDLGLRGNLITDIRPLSSLVNLIRLDLLAASEPNDNHITDISPVAGMGKLQELYLSGNPIRDIRAVAGLTTLRILDLDRTGVLTDITPVAGLTGLWALNLSLNQISDLRPLAGLKTLEHLTLEHNRIVDISPVAGLTNLTYLDLGNLGPGANQITDIRPLAGLAKLQTLRLRWNLIQDISALAGLTGLHDLSLEGNPLDAKACAVYIPVIKLNNPGINISYDACLGRVYTLTISSTPGGSVTNPGEGAFICNDGESVPIEAVAKAGYRFKNWSGTAVDAGKVAKPDAASTSVVVTGDYTLVANFALNAAVEDFEKGKLGAGWSSPEYPQWYVTSQDRHSGKYSTRAGAIGDNESTSLILRANVTAGRISFWRKVSSEPKFDVYRFSIDGKVQEVVSGEQGWQEISFPVSAGSHTFTWEYTKDSGSSRGADTVYIDDVSIPPAP
jgi:internalin A